MQNLNTLTINRVSLHMIFFLMTSRTTYTYKGCTAYLTFKGFLPSNVFFYVFRDYCHTQRLYYTASIHRVPPQYVLFYVFGNNNIVKSILITFVGFLSGIYSLRYLTMTMTFKDFTTISTLIRFL